MRKSIKNKNKPQIKNKGSKKKSAPKRQKSQTKSKSKSCPPNMMPVKVKNSLLCVGRCPHSGGIIKYDPSTKDLKCMMHGSRFDAKTGKVKMGSGPAVSNLKIIK